jgi:hypothetical protein
MSVGGNGDDFCLHMQLWCKFEGEDDVAEKLREIVPQRIDDKVLRPLVLIIS